MSDKQTALVPTVSAQTALEPNSVNEAFFLATKLVQSGLLGKAIQKPEAALAVILAGRELGLTTMQSLRSIHVIEGKPTLSSDLMAALVKRSPTCTYFKLVESTPTIATYETDRVGEGVSRMSFTIEEAQAAGLASKNNWKSYPAAMLRARCIAVLARAVYPDLLAGIYETDEIPARVATAVATMTERSAPQATVDAEDAELVTPEPEAESDNEKIARWRAAIVATTDLAQLEQLGRELGVEPKTEHVRLALSPLYVERKKALKAGTPGSEVAA